MKVTVEIENDENLSREDFDQIVKEADKLTCIAKEQGCSVKEVISISS